MDQRLFVFHGMQRLEQEKFTTNGKNESTERKQAKDIYVLIVNYRGNKKKFPTSLLRTGENQESLQYENTLSSSQS